MDNPYTFQTRHPRELAVQLFAAARLAEVAHACLAIRPPETLALGLDITPLPDPGQLVPRVHERAQGEAAVTYRDDGPRGERFDGRHGRCGDRRAEELIG